jgi:hypothetical protein
VTAGCRLFLALVFLVAAAGKFSRPADFLGTVLDFRLLPAGLAPWFASALPGVELLAGLILAAAVFSPPRRPGPWLRWTEAAEWTAVLLLAAFTLAIAINLIRGVSMNCGCFDILGHYLGRWLPFLKSGKATWWTVVRDLVMLAPAVWLVRRQR